MNDTPKKLKEQNADPLGSSAATGCVECGNTAKEVGFKCETFTVCRECYDKAKKDWLNWQDTDEYKKELIHGKQLPDLIK